MRSPAPKGARGKHPAAAKGKFPVLIFPFSPFDVEEARRLVPALGVAFGEIRGRLKRIQENRELLKSLAEPAGEIVEGAARGARAVNCPGS